MRLLQAHTQRSERTQAPSTPETRLHGRSLLLARALWLVLTVGALSIFIANIPSRFDLLRSYALTHLVGLEQIGLSSTSFAFYFMAFYIATMIIYSFTALIIFWRRSDDWMAILTSGGVALYGTYGTFLFFSLGRFQSPENGALTLIQALGLGWTINHYYFFPSGRFIPHWTCVPTFVYTAWAFTWFFYPATNVFTWPLWLSFVVIVTFIAIGVFAQFQRYRYASNAIERQQTKWIVFGLTFIAVGLTGFHLSRLLSPSGLTQTLIDVVGIPVIILCELVALAGVSLAILRYRLWDTDPLINRVLVYGTLTGMLAAIYFGLIIALQFLLGGFMSQINNLVIVGSTLIIAILFQPVRRRIQIIIDHRFYRRKYDAARTLEIFSTTLQNELELTQLSEQLLVVINETMQPTQASLWLRPPEWWKEDQPHRLEALGPGATK